MHRKGPDVLQSILAFPKWAAWCVYLSPDTTGPLKRTWIIVLTLVCTFFEISQIMYFVECKKVDDLVIRIPTFAINFQAIYKALVLYIYDNTIADIIKTMETKFWKYDELNSTQKSIARRSNFLIIYMKFYYIIGTTYLTMMSIHCFIHIDSRELLLRSRFPFDWRASPTFEILLILQLMVEFLILLPTVIAADCFFWVICHSINCQYEHLKEVVGFLGETTITDKFMLSEHLSRNMADTRRKTNNKNREFLILCMNHHTLLLETAKKLERVYNFPNLIQLFSSVFSMCFSTFVLTNTREGVLVVAALVYSVGHFMELFSICLLGNELTHRASLLAQSIFDSKWYEEHDKVLRADLIIFLRRLADAPVLTAYKMWTLNYETCISVLKLTFSFYTCLSKMEVKATTSAQ